MRRPLRVGALAAAILLVVAASAVATPTAIPTATGPLDIPAAVPPQFRALVRERLHSPQPRSSSETSVELKTRSGYKVTVIGLGHIVAVVVAPKKATKSGHGKSRVRGEAFTAYVARGKATSTRIRASFGDFGKVDLRFRPSGRIARSKPRRRCKGPDRFTTRFGVFAGGIEFTGEGSYVSVSAHRAKGNVRSPAHLHCSSIHIIRPVKRSVDPERGVTIFTPTILAALWRHAVSATNFVAFKIDAKTLFLAIAEQSLGSVAEVRYALAVAPSKRFASDDALTSATVTPPSPFAGTGTYSAGPDGTKTWTGPLSVSFPGAPRFPLTGPQFEPVLEAGF